MGTGASARVENVLFSVAGQTEGIKLCLRICAAEMKDNGFMEKTFKINGDYIELIKLLKITGLCDTGGMAQAVTADGQVSVDGKVELRKRCKIRPGQKVSYAGHIVAVQ